MKRRLFALLLAVVMILGLSAPVFGEDEAAPAGEPLTAENAAEPDGTAGPDDADADVGDETKTGDEVQSEDDANAEDEVQSEDDANADAEDDTDADDVSHVAQLDEPQALADEPITVTLTGETDEVTLTKLDGSSFNGGEVESQTDEGTSTTGYLLKVTKFSEHFSIKATAPDECNLFSAADGGQLLNLMDQNGDKEVELKVEEDRHVIVDALVNNAGVTLKQVGGAEYKAGEKVYAADVPGVGNNVFALLVEGAQPSTVFTVRENGAPEKKVLLINNYVCLTDLDEDSHIGQLVVENLPTITIRLTGATDKIKSLTDMQRNLTDGSIITSEQSDIGHVNLYGEFEEGYTIKTVYDPDTVTAHKISGTDRWNIVIEDSDGDGVVTIEVVDRPVVTVLVQDTAGKAVLKDEDGKAVKSGDKVYFDSLISVTVSDSAYTVLGDRFCRVYKQGAEGEYTVEFYGVGSYRPEQITLRVVPYVSLHKEGEGLISVSEPYAEEGYEEGDQLLAGESYYAEVKSGFAVEVTGGTVKLADTGIPGGYVLNPETGVFTRRYEVTPDGSGPVTVKAVPTAEQAPTPIRISYVDPEGAFSWDDPRWNYCWPGDAFTCMVKDGYGITVTGGTYEHHGNDEGLSYFLVSVDDDATALTITAVKLAAGAVLKVSGSPEGLAGSYDGDTYDVDGSVLANGYGYVLVKSGYAITGVTGGRTEYAGYATDMEKPGTSEIYAIYYVEASEATVTLTVSAAAPNRWVKVNIVNNFAKSGAAVERYTFIDENGGEWVPIIPNEPLANMVWVGLDDYADNDVSDYTVAVQGGAVVDEYLASDLSYSSYEIDPGASSEVTVTVVKKDLQPDLEVKVPDKPAAGVPGVPDKAATEKKLMDTAAAVVDAALKGETPAGVTKADAAAIAKAAAEGKTITAQLVATAVTAPADAAALQAAAGKDTITQYVDIQIVVLADGEQIGHITETDQALDFAVVLSDEELAKGGIFYVIRSHDGATSVLSARLSGNVLGFSSDKFSTFAVANSNNIALADVEAIPDQTWTGKEVRPAVKVTANGSKTLTEGVDYTVSYKNNVNTGTATVVITGIGAYTGTKEVTFRIVAPAKPAGTPGTAPATGDETPLALYAGLLVLSAAGLALVLSRKKRTEK